MKLLHLPVHLLILAGNAQAGIELGVLEQVVAQATSSPTKEPRASSAIDISDAYDGIKDLMLEHFDKGSCKERINGNRYSFKCKEDGKTATLIRAGQRIVKLSQCKVLSDEKCKEVTGVATLEPSKALQEAKRLFRELNAFKSIRAMLFDMFKEGACEEVEYGFTSRIEEVDCKHGKRTVFMRSRNGMITDLEECNVREEGVCRDVDDFTENQYQNIKKGKAVLGYGDDFGKISDMLVDRYGKEKCSAEEDGDSQVFKCVSEQGKTATLTRRKKQLQSLEECVSAGNCNAVSFSVYRRENITAARKFLASSS